VTAPQYTNVHAYAKAETQPAKVTDNNDPAGLGRVQVSFIGQAEIPTATGYDSYNLIPEPEKAFISSPKFTRKC